MRQISEDAWVVESIDPSQTSSGNSSFKRIVVKVNSNARCRFCLWLVALFCAANVIFMLMWYDLVVQKVAVGHMVLQEDGGAKYEAWKEAPMPVYYKVTVFNLTNPHSFIMGDRPRLKECGPYTYRMLEEKIDVEFHDNDTVTYRTRPMYIFEKHLSQGSEDDVIWTVNIPFINAADAVKSNSVMKTIIQVAQKIHGFKTLRQLSVRDLLWGYQSHVMDWARTMQEIPYPHHQFGLLVGFNNTPQQPYTMYTGASDPSIMNTIYSWNGMTHLEFWDGDFCNQIRGTDASGFHPGVKPTDKLYIFNGQLCRSLPLVYERTVVHSGVETYRFVPPSNTFAYGDENPENSCFCSASGCPLKGLLDMKPCYYGAAVAFSFPHFYQSDPSLRHMVRGLKPDPERHGTQFDIYPKLGVPLRVKLRMQMNVVIDSKQALQRARHFDVVFPVFWFEAGIDSLPGEMVGMLKMAQNLPLVVKTTSVTICTTLTVVFLLLLLASSVAGWCGITPHSSRTQTPDHLPDTHWQAGHPNVVLNSSGYAPGSMASLGPDESYPSGHPSFRKPFYHNSEVPDGFNGSTYDLAFSDDQPPAYTSGPDTTKASSSSLVSVEIHKSASIHTIDTTPTPDETLDDELSRKRETPDSEERRFVEENPQRGSPSSPPPPVVSPIITPITDTDNAGASPIEEPPLATSSRHESPNTTTAPDEGDTCPPSSCDNRSLDSKPAFLESDL